MDLLQENARHATSKAAADITPVSVMFSCDGAHKFCGHGCHVVAKKKVPRS
jgi:hypothetical protein